ncbi:MAG TPA: 3-phosphoshikimate 1-carboxyvinyltransferase [Thermoanaerobaculia bacterium]|nr:3-phosphoshikimate 1-carboxyvinyltransferase [Thermoanaerobaculia bacterium]
MTTRLIPSGRRALGSLIPPSSKSFTHRAFNLALLARAPLEVRRPLWAEDTKLFAGCLETLGFRVTPSADGVALQPGALPAGGVFYCGNAGTLFRFLVAALATQKGTWQVDGSPRLRERPIGPLVEALRPLGARIRYLAAEGHAPLEIAGGTLEGGLTTLDAGESSQYLSALLMAGLAAKASVEVEVAALTSEPYVNVTLASIARFGGKVERPSPSRWRVEPGLAPPAEITIEGDYSAACYPAAAAALTGGEVNLRGLDPESSQGDRAFFDLLGRMGARVERQEDGFSIRGTGELTAVDVDLSSMPDQVPTLAALAVFARGTSRITNVAHLRIKESDRLAAMASELRRAGARVEEQADGLTIEGCWFRAEPPANPVVIDPHDDHRIAMSLALVGLRRPGISIAHPEVVSKSYPGFFEDLESLLQATSARRQPT